MQQERLAGYITHVTGKKFPINDPHDPEGEYFNFFFQTSEWTTKRCLCFDSARRSYLKALEGLDVVLTFSGFVKNNWVLPYSSRVVEGLHNLEFRIKLFNTINEISKDKTDRKVNVKCQIISEISSRKEVTIWDGDTMDRQIFLVEDGTKEMELAAWDSDIDKLEVGDNYSFHDITVKMYKGKQYLSTNRYTVITNLDDPGHEMC